MEIKGYNVPTKLSEMTIGQFEKVNKIMSDESSLKIERYIDYLESLDIPNDVILSITDDELFSVIKSIGEKEDITNELLKSFELEGYTYKSYDEEFSIRAIELSMIEKRINKDSSNYFSYIIAILFKREDLTNREHYTDAHIKHKADLFKNLSAIDFYPYVIMVAEKLSKNLKSLYESSK